MSHHAFVSGDYYGGCLSCGYGAGHAFHRPATGMKAGRAKHPGGEHIEVTAEKDEIDAILRALEQPHILKSLHTLGVALLLDDRFRTLRTPHKKTTFSVRIDHEDAMPVVVHLENK